jgi:hypothetical protein
VARQRPSVQKRQREYEKRQREIEKAKKAALKRERRAGRIAGVSSDLSPADGVEREDARDPGERLL